MKKIISTVLITFLLVTAACALENSGKPTASTGSTAAAPSKGETSVNKTTRVKITVKGKTLYAAFDDNATSRAIIAQIPMTLPMLKLYGDEMCYRYPQALPTDSVKSYIHKKGEIFYWPPGHSFVIRYVSTNEKLDIQHIGQIESGVEIFN